MQPWLNEAIIYEIYPVSFYDSNGDGIGDFNGITQKIPYLKDLGINTVWLNPFYKSPFRDGGYDVSDYYAVDPMFGTMEDCENMFKAFHEAGIRVIVDLVVGHTSDKHPWFLQSKKGKPHPKYKDWYIWTPSCFTSAPRAMSGMSKRNGNYLINYYAFQPALNYGYNKIEKGKEAWQWHYTDERLKPLRDEIKNIIRYWLGKGVDGFRVDLAQSLVKADPDQEGVKWFWNIVIGETKKSYPDCCFLAEWGDPIKAVECGFDLDYLCHATDGYNQIFRSEKGSNLGDYWERAEHSYFSKDGLGSFQGFLDYVNEFYQKTNGNGAFSLPSGYHDMIRIAHQKDTGVLKCIFAFLLTFKGIPQIYYGDEIGIRHNFQVNKDGGYVRTGARTPMQWDNTPHRGFTKAKRAYLPTERAKNRSVESQLADENSLLNTVKRLIKLHADYPQFAFDAGLKMLNSGYPLEYILECGGEKIFVCINCTEREYTASKKVKEILLSENADVVGGGVRVKKGFVIAKI